MDNEGVSPVASPQRNGSMDLPEPSSPLEANRASAGAPVTAPAPASAPAPAPVDEAAQKAVDDVLYSDIGVNTLLTRLKQSIASANDFAGFLKKRSQIEDEHSKELRKLARNTHETLRRPDVKQGSYLAQFSEVTAVHERMAENGAQFSLSLHQMHEDLEGLALNMEKGRKHWKHTALAAESRVSEAEKQMEKAKTKYDQLAEDYDGVKTGDKKVRGRFGIGGPKNEDDLQSRVQQADGDYAQRVQHAKGQRQELTSTLRPQAIRAIQELIAECDSALTLQLQKFASFNEKLLLGNGLLITPLSDASTPGKEGKSLREIAHQIDNQRDLHMYIRGHSSKVPPRPKEIVYEQHPTQRPYPSKPPAPQQMQQPAPPAASQMRPESSGRQQPTAQPQQTFGVVGAAAPQLPQFSMQNDQRPQSRDRLQTPQNQTPSTRIASDSFSPSSSMNSQPPGAPQYQAYNAYQHPSGPQHSSGPSGQFNDLRSSPQQYPGPGPGPGPQGPPASQYPGPGGPPPSQYPGPGGQGPPPSQYPGPGSQGPQSQYRGADSQGPPSSQYPGPGGPTFGTIVPNGPRPGSSGIGGPMSRNGPPARPCFGLSLEDLFIRDQTPIPKVVMDCLTAVDMFGLEVEGIYRVPGTSGHIQQLKALFDNDADNVDFRTPEAFYHDVNSVAGLLKQFFRELPEPLMTNEHYQRFIEAARLNDTTARRDSIHAAINELPDPNYATLRALVLHLWRVQEHSDKNRMSSMNLAICFAPTIMGPHKGPMADAGLQAQVVDTILLNTLQIFDDD